MAERNILGRGRGCCCKSTYRPLNINVVLYWKSNSYHCSTMPDPLYQFCQNRLSRAVIIMSVVHGFKGTLTLKTCTQTSKNISIVLLLWTMSVSKRFLSKFSSVYSMFIVNINQYIFTKWKVMLIICQGNFFSSCKELESENEWACEARRGGFVGAAQAPIS